VAFNSVTTGSGGTSKPYFAWNGWRAVTLVVFSENAAHISPDRGDMPCLTVEVEVYASGGSQRIVMTNSVSGGGVVYSGSYNPAGTADLTSARYANKKSLTKAVVAGDSYYVGIVCDDASSGVGFYRDTSGTTYLVRSDNATDSTWTGDLRSTTWYNTIPAAPTLNSAVDSLTFGAVDLAWTAGADGGTAITGYRVEWSTDSFATLAGSIADTGSTATTRTITGLTSGQSYQFRVAAINAVSNAFSGQPASIRSNVISSTPTSYGSRFSGSSFVAIQAAKRYDQGSGQWVSLTSAKRYNAATSSWVNIT
jgi:hypothetical protein